MNINQGENVLIETTLFESDGTTPLVIANLVLLEARIKQADRVRATYRLGIHNEIRVGSASNKVEVEITRFLAGLLDKGPINLRLVMELEDNTFEVDQVQRDEHETEIFTIV